MTGLLHIFPLTSAWLQADKSHTAADVMRCMTCLNKETGPLVFSGGDHCGKTALLFQAAISYATQDSQVVVISPRPLTRMPPTVHGMLRPEKAGLLKTLTFQYLSTAADLIKYCSSVHMKPVLPEVLIVDELDHYLGGLTEPSPEGGAAKLCAIILDALAFLKTKSTSESCILLLGCRNKQSFLPGVFQQFRFNMASIEDINTDRREYRLKLATPTTNLTMSYNIPSVTGGQSSLVLQTIDFIT